MATLAAVIVLAGGCGFLLGIHIETIVLSIAAVLATTLVVAAGVRAVGHARLSRRLFNLSHTGTLAGTPVRTAPGIETMVAGLIRPTVYCGDEVPTRLTHGEQRAVLLHEHCHQRRRDPARLVILDTVEQVLGRIPAIRRHVTDARAHMEIRADRYALAHGATRAELAGALVALSATPVMVGAGFATVTQQRLAALLDEPPPRRRQPGAALIGLVLVVVVTLASCAPALSDSHGELAVAARCLAGACGVGG